MAPDALQLSDLVRSLRALATDSPERQSRIEEIARMYASGSYQLDGEATAMGIISDAIESKPSNKP